MKPSNRPLRIAVIGDELIISIGVSTLAYALQNGPDTFGAQITDAKSFAKDIAHELGYAPNDGDSLLQCLISEAANRAVEGGSKHVVLDGDSQPSIYPSERS